MTTNVDHIDISLFCDGRVIFVSDFVYVIRAVTPDDQLDNVEAIAESVLSRCLAENRFDTVVFRSTAPSFSDDVNERIFDALVSHYRIRDTYIFPPVDADSLPGLLARAFPKMTNMTRIALPVTEMSTLQADRLFEVIQRGLPSGRLDLVCNVEGIADGNDNVLASVNKFLRETTQLKSLSLHTADGAVGLSAASFDSFCHALGECPSPLFFLLTLANDLVQQGASERAAQSLVDAIVKKRRARLITSLFINKMNESTSALSMDQIAQALLRADAVQNFDLSFIVRSEDDTLCQMTIASTGNVHYPVPWKPISSQDIPLSLWPLILGKANSWNKMTSHSSFDALFFLLKEKSDVLLQNIHRRRIRKRKCFQLDA